MPRAWSRPRSIPLNRRPAAQIAGRRITEIHLRLGPLAGVVKDSLLFCYDLVTADTPLAGTRLVVEEVPVIIFCESCQAEVQLPGTQSFYCPRCGQPGTDVRQGRELEIVGLYLADPSDSLEA